MPNNQIRKYSLRRAGCSAVGLPVAILSIPTVYRQILKRLRFFVRFPPGTGASAYLRRGHI